MKNLIERDKKKRLFVAKYEQKRFILKTIVTNCNLPLSVRWLASMELSTLPKNSSRTRLNNRCIMTGRGKAVIRAFQISRISLRTLGNCGSISGLTKSSW